MNDVAMTPRADFEVSCICAARVSKASDTEVLFDLGGGRVGSLRDADLKGHKLAVGDSAEVFVDDITDKEGRPKVSPAMAEKLRLWDTLANAVGKHELIEGEVVAVVKGGLSVDVGMRAFLPASHATLAPTAERGALVGEKVKVEVIEFRAKRGELVVSRKRQLEVERIGQRKQTLASLARGDIVTGVVRRFATFGAFVDVGGVDGLLHVSDMRWTRVNDPREVLAQGDEIRVQVLEVDRDEGKVSLGLKQLSPDPWSAVEHKYPVGTRVQGPVRGLADYGAFIEIEPGIEGMVHATELSWDKRAPHPKDVLHRGEVVDAVVLSVEQEERRIGLSIKQLSEDPWLAYARRYVKGSVVKGKVARLADFGAFIELEEGLDGLCHISQLSHERVEKPSDAVRVGDEVEVRVLDVDTESHRISLSRKGAAEVVEELPSEPEPRPGDDKVFSNSLAEKLKHTLGERS
ncbi:MAG: S1 RNA-binding domain-containing protein [Myxococcota bacterium]